MLSLGVLFTDGGHRPPMPPLFRGRRNIWQIVRKAVDRFVAEECIDSGIAIKGEKFARVSVLGIHGRNLWTIPCVCARERGMEYPLSRRLWSRP
jgi:hypothetical protein